jgi:hypothetical protein
LPVIRHGCHESNMLHHHSICVCPGARLESGPYAIVFKTLMD